MTSESDSNRQALLRLLEHKRRHQRLELAQHRTIPQLPRNAPLALSFAQQRLWFLDRLLPGQGIYNSAFAWQLQGRLDVPALQRSVQELVTRHETLRTRFGVTDGQPLQFIEPAATVALELTDLSAFEPCEGLTQARERLGQEARAPFDLERGPVLRAQLLRLGEFEHWLLITVHHIAFDGWSGSVLQRELAAAYNALAGGHALQWPALSIQYADHALWQRAQSQSPQFERKLAFWKEQLTALAILQLPTDRVRPAMQSYRGQRLAFELPATLLHELRALSRREGATLYMTLLAAFEVLLGRHSAQQDVAVGTPTAARAHTELEGLIGFFVNTLVMRADLSANPPFLALLSQVRERALQVYEHLDVPFECLVEELNPVRDPSRSPLVQVMFVLQNTPDATLRLDGLQVSALPIESHSAKFDLTLTLTERPDGLHGELEYATDLFERATIERMAGHFAVLLQGIVAKPETPIDRLPMLTDAERHQLLVTWNDTSVDYPRERCIHQLFEEQVARTPEAVALVFEDQQLSYRELNARANQLAHHLLALGVGPEVLVGICVERSLELIIGLLGILKAGGAYVPLDPSYPPARLAFMLADTQAPVLLTQQTLLAQLPPYAGRTVCLDRDGENIAAQPDTAPPCRATAENLAYVIYTSGSTGRPKGVTVPHRGVLRLLLGIDYVQLDQQQTFLLLSPISFDASTFELWGALLHGARCAIFHERVPTIATLGETLGRYQVTTLWLTASLFNVLIDEAPQILGGVRQLLTGGEALSPSHVRAALKCLPEVQLVNGYGPTESTTFTCCYRIPKLSDEARASIPIGRPIGNTRVYVLDRSLGPVPVGVTGELCITGDGLARGYLNRPELTAEKFLPDPFSAVPGARLYRTGDRARYLPDGNIEFLGRLDDQVKIRGFRIELGEIERVLAEHPAVCQAVVLARADTPGDQRLVAYVVPADAALTDSEPLRAFLRERLPDYLRPATYVLLADLPLTPNGKLDRKALPAPQYGREDLGSTFVPPRNSLEALIAEVWGEVLQIERVGVHDNFFDLGGHSLLAAQVLARLIKILKVELPLRAFFENPTVSALAAAAQSSLGAAEASESSPLTRTPRQGNLPLSFAQQRLWLLDQLLPDQAAYNIPSAWRLQGSLDIPALERSLTALVARHETLRTRFVLSEGEPVQIIDLPYAVALPLTDLSAMTQRQHEASQLANAQACEPFDLAAGPLLRAQLLRLGLAEHLLLLNVHHIASDGWSSGILERDLSAVYNAFVTGHPPPLPALPIQYADYAVWQREWLQGEVLARQLAYWQTQLANLSTLELPTDRPRPPLASHHGEHLAWVLPEALTVALKALARRANATLFMTLLASFQVLLHRYSGQDDIAVGSPIAGRGRTELEGLIGFFVNTLVLRTDLSGNPPFQELLARVREHALGAYTHQDLPFEKLVEALAPARDLSRNPLFQVMFVLQNTPGAALALALEGLAASRVPLEGHSAKFDLALSLQESADGLQASWEYASDLFDAATIERMAGHFQVLLEAIVANPEQRIDELPLLTAPERHQLLVQWNDTATDYPKDRCIHQLFEDQATRTPNAVAVVCEDQQLTYAHLNARANQLAHHLLALGVGPEVLVGICVERSLELIIGLLGILKAGGAYVPLDPSYPPARLAFMLADTQAPVLLTQQTLLAQLPPYAGRTVCLDRDGENIAAQPDTAPPCRATAENLAYVIYTSGSTGRPKGVTVPHRGVLRLLLGIDYVQLDQQQTFLLLSPISFDASTFELWGALLHGARCAIFHERVPTIATLGETLGRYQVTTLWLTASLFNVLIDEAPQILGGVRQLLTGGEALSPSHVRAALKCLPEVQLVNGYGPTESTTFTCCYRIPKLSDEARASIPIGRPIGNTRVYVLDRSLGPVPVGVTGELCITGDGLARGYLNRPELTAEKFLPDPFSAVPGARLYRTGDRARYLPDGNIEFLGRLDDQVKIRGFRIELGEIERVLAEHPAVCQAVVLARADTPGDQRLVAYVVPADAALTDSEPLRAFLRERLPDYLRPATYVLLADLPLTPNGKLDRKALPNPGAVALASNGYTAPRDDLERTLCEAWAQVLGVERVGLDDDFFVLGGHSLLAARLFARLDQALGQSLALGVLFSAPSVRQLANHYRQAIALGNPAAAALVVLRREGTQRPLYFLPGVYGNVVGYGDFVRELGPDQPIYGLQSIGLDGLAEPITSIEAMAAHYLTEIRAQQSQGPYGLIGTCFGATVAYEMARQLMAAGEVVAFLGLLAPSTREGDAAGKRVVVLPQAVRRVVVWLNLARNRLRGYRLAMQGQGIAGRLRYLLGKLQALRATVVLPSGSRGIAREVHQLGVYHANLHALDHYVRQPLEGPLVAFEILDISGTGPRLHTSTVSWQAFWQGPITLHVLSARDSGDLLAGANARAAAMLLNERLRMTSTASTSTPAAPVRPTDASA